MRSIWLALLALSSMPALAQHPAHDMEIHQRFYQGWMRPDKPTQSCCNNQDCYPTALKMANGAWYAQRREDGAWIKVPPEKFEQHRDNPDGRSHVCMQPPGQSDNVFCAILGWAG